MIVACPSCKARFDVTAFKPGSKIRCGSCYKILKIPERPGEQAPKAQQPAPAKQAPQAPVPAKKRGAPARKKASPAPVPAKKRRRAVQEPPKKPAPPPAKPAPPPKKPAPPPPKPAPPPPKPAPPPEPAPPAPEPAPPPPAEAQPVAKKKPSDPLVGHRLNNEFELIRKIGEGGYGSVYEATDLTLKRRVAVKLMLREKTTNKEFVEKFLREARTAAQLNHPNIVKIHFVGFDQELQQHFLAMEYVEGHALSDIMNDEGALSVERAVDVVIQSANGLGEAHRKKIIHRDIKPGNIMITPKGVVKVADFGLAKIYDPNDAASMVIGTPFFMPPEQFDGKVKDGRSDIYSLGITFYYLLTLKRPFDGNTPARVLMNILTKDPTPPQKYNEKIPEGIWSVIKKMIAREVNERFDSCEELLRALKGYQEAADAEEKVFCPSCGFGNPLTSEKCVECDTSLLEPCPVCGTPDHVNAKFCGNCGANLEKEKAVAALISEAETLATSGRLEPAIDKYREAREASPENSRAVQGMREAEQALGQRKEAIRDVKRLLDQGDFLAAHEKAEAAASEHTGSEELSGLLAQAAELAKDARFRAALENSRTSQEAGDLEEALRQAQQAVEIEPDSQDAAQRLEEVGELRTRVLEAKGNAARLEEVGDLSGALEAWREALELAPKDGASAEAVSRLEGSVGKLSDLRDRAGEALDARDLTKARVALEEACALQPGDADTISLLSRLRQAEEGYREALSGAFDRMLAGDHADAADRLDELAKEYPAEGEVSAAAGRLREILAVAEKFKVEGGEFLDADRPEMAGMFLRAARQFLPLDPDVEDMLTQVKDRKRSRLEKLAGIRAQVEKGEFEAAIEALDELGGPSSARPEVAELAVRAAEGLRDRIRKEREERDSVLAASLATAEELLEAGRAQAALAACEKALSIEPEHARVLALKERIEKAMKEVVEEPVEREVTETGFFDMRKIVAESGEQ